LSSDLQRRYRWRNRQRYGLAYGISAELHAEVDLAHANLAKRFSYRSSWARRCRRSW